MKKQKNKNPYRKTVKKNPLKSMSKRGKILSVLLVLVLFAGIFGIYKTNSNPYRSLNYNKYIETGRAEGLKAQKGSFKVTENDIKAAIKENIDKETKYDEVKSGTVKKGDTVLINYLGKIKGEKVPEATASRQSLKIGSGNFIKGFEEGLIGKKIGDKVTLKLKFPKDYNEKFAGKDITFDVEILAKKKTVAPKYNEDFIKKTSKFKTKKEYENNLKKEIKKKKKLSHKEEQKSLLWSKLVSSTKVNKYPDKLVKAEKERILVMYRKIAENNNISLDEFLKTYMNTNKKDFEKQVDTFAKTQVKNKMTANSIVKEKNINVSRLEYGKYKDAALEKQGLNYSEFEKKYKISFNKYAKENDLYNSFVINQVMNYMFDNADFK